MGRFWVLRGLVPAEAPQICRAREKRRHRGQFPTQGKEGGEAGGQRELFGDLKLKKRNQKAAERRAGSGWARNRREGTRRRKAGTGGELPWLGAGVASPPSPPNPEGTAVALEVPSRASGGKLRALEGFFWPPFTCN